MRKIILLITMAVLLSGCLAKKTTQPETKTEEEFSGTIQQAMKLGVPMKCEWKQNEDSGTSYVKGKDMYVEMTVQGKTGYLIQKDNCMWSWNKDEKQGFKICSEEKAENEAETDLAQPENFQAKGVNLDVEYKCAPALISGDKFSPPADITFTDFGEMMKGLPVPSVPAGE